MAKIGHGDTVTDSTKQGGLAAAYYFGGMWGCFIGGKGTPTVALLQELFVDSCVT